MKRLSKTQVIEAARSMKPPFSGASEPHQIVANPNVTKEGIEVKVGQVWEDLDWRMGGRSRRVVEVNDGKATMAYTHDSDRGRTKVSIKRMHKHSTGWKLVTDV